MKVGPTGFAKWLDYGCEERIELVKGKEGFWSEQLAGSGETGKMARGTGLGRKGRSLVLNSSALRCQL